MLMQALLTRLWLVSVAHCSCPAAVVHVCSATVDCRAADIDSETA